MRVLASGAAKTQAMGGGGFAFLRGVAKLVFRGKTLGVLHTVVFANRFAGVFSSVGTAQAQCKTGEVLRSSRRAAYQNPSKRLVVSLYLVVKEPFGRPDYRRLGGRMLILFLAGVKCLAKATSQARRAGTPPSRCRKAPVSFCLHRAEEVQSG